MFAPLLAKGQFAMEEAMDKEIFFDPARSALLCMDFRLASYLCW